MSTSSWKRLRERPERMGGTVPPASLLSSITVPPGIAIRPTGLVLIVGPNSAGKTQLLKDITAILTGKQRDLVVCSDFQLTKPQNVEDPMKTFYDSGFLERRRDDNGNEFIRQISPHLGGSPFRGHDVRIGNVPTFYRDLRTAKSAPGRVEAAPFLDLIGHCLTTVLFLENRMMMANQANHFDYAKNPPSIDLQALYISKAAKQQLTQETERVFGKGVWLDSTRGGILCLRVNQLPSVPSAEDRQEPEEMMKYRQIETEGDGLRSYVGICIALLLGRRPVCILDEPELCLHPPQAYAMGQFIGRNGASPDHVTFASTHSSHVLRGVIESTENVQILRLTKDGDRFQGHLIGFDTLKECLKRPIVRTETILDGIFADSVVIVEADGDRAVYEAAWEVLRSESSHTSVPPDAIRRDLLFIPVGGTGGITETAGFYRALRIPTVIVADLDLIMDSDKLRRILQSSGDAEATTQLTEKCRLIRDLIRTLPPTVPENVIFDKLREVSELKLRWDEDGDQQLMEKLRGLVDDLKRMRRIKGGLSAFAAHPEIHDGLKDIVSQCAKLGLFLVPVGELECWAPELMKDGPSRRRKSEWANEASARIRSNPSMARDLLDFMGAIALYQAAEAKRIAVL
ncbi:TOPRIM nucleotidyl transferase/hydrolase domain-containing protein [Planctellipticum variicoloris]|uniref:TOPRIM nucleotidyl transferase/hydrolase domain-containing protein n=1 Tax=Planctellipticum variicoloris TaxID=3064265 RepID=UPI003013C888|nr:hypothetical protein SH412_001998 [Planctomycetaceae bacterium SH412]